MNDLGHLWRRDEEYRQSVIRKALLMGFSCEEYEVGRMSSLGAGPTYKRWRFMFDSSQRDGYNSLYSAAFDYLRLLKVPLEVIGDYRG